MTARTAPLLVILAVAVAVVVAHIPTHDRPACVTGSITAILTDCAR